LKIESKAKVFCANNSVKELADIGFYEAYDELGNYAKINFSTSRNFSGVDILLDYKPDVIIVSDAIRAPHSILDPSIESVQICGRFRKGCGEISHLTNYNTNLTSLSAAEAKAYLNGAFSVYTDILNKSKHAKN